MRACFRQHRATGRPRMSLVLLSGRASPWGHGGTHKPSPHAAAASGVQHCPASTSSSSRAAAASPAAALGPRHQHHDGNDNGSDQTALAALLVRACLATATSLAAVSMVPSPAQAREAVWRPRRHYRRMDERYTRHWAEDIAEVRWAWQPRARATVVVL